MAGSFGQTMRALGADRSRGGWLLITIIGAFAVGWIAWMVAAEVPVYESTPRARLEVLPAPSVIGAPIAGRVERVNLQVGRRVAAGDVLVELESAAQRVELTRARDQLAAFGPELASLDREIAAEQ
ncbi:MAG TPA: biotin/lipoyl-binding protein, partial [Kofleriaceae bacterium]|nr:biotin/lipoyl-binding protein [Kofleriaceae bacterium]